MKKILFLSPITYDTCSFYRSGGIAPDLRAKLNIDIQVTSLDREKFDWVKMLDYNLVMFQRPFTETSFNMALYVKSLGIPLWVDLDDHMLDLPAGNPGYELLTMSRETIIKFIALADVVSVTTELLKQQLVAYNKNVRVIPNAFNDYIFKKRGDKEPRSKTILWRGGNSHTPDLMRYAQTMDKLMQEFPEWQFMFYGLLPWYYNNYGNLAYLQSTDPIFYFKKIVTMAAPVIHVPLDDSVFNRCKSNIAFIEGAYSGAACIAPDWDEWKKPGIMTYKTDQEYYDLVKKVITGDINVKKHADRSWEYICDQLLLSKVNNLRVDLVKTLLG